MPTLRLWRRTYVHTYIYICTYVNGCVNNDGRVRVFHKEKFSCKNFMGWINACKLKCRSSKKFIVALFIKMYTYLHATKLNIILRATSTDCTCSVKCHHVILLYVRLSTCHWSILPGAFVDSMASNYIQ